MPHNTEKITHAYKWHYLAVKSLPALFRGITSKHEGSFYCLICFQSYTKENKLRKHKKVCENNEYCYVGMPEKDNKIQPRRKIYRFHLLSKVPFIIMLI